MTKMKALPVLFCSLLFSCSQLGLKKDVVTYAELKAEKNYYDSLPHFKIWDNSCPYRYYLHGDPYTGRVEDYYSPGHPKLLGAMQDGYAIGEWKYYRDNDSLKQAGAFEKGYVKDEWKFYDRHGHLTQKLKYNVKGRQVRVDTLIVTYDDGSRKEYADGMINVYYSSGSRQSLMSSDHKTGFIVDESGQRIAELKDYVLEYKKSGDRTYYLDRGKNRPAYEALMKANKNWTDEEKRALEGAQMVIFTATRLGPFTTQYRTRVVY